MTILGDNFFNNFTTSPLPVRVKVGNQTFQSPILVNQNTITVSLPSGTNLSLGLNPVSISLDAGVQYTNNSVFFETRIACPGGNQFFFQFCQLILFFFKKNKQKVGIAVEMVIALTEIALAMQVGARNIKFLFSVLFKYTIYFINIVEAQVVVIHCKQMRVEIHQILAVKFFFVLLFKFNLSKL